MNRAPKLWTRASQRGHPGASTELAKFRLRRAARRNEVLKKEEKEEIERLLELAAQCDYRPAKDLLQVLRQK